MGIGDGFLKFNDIMYFVLNILDTATTILEFQFSLFPKVFFAAV